MMGTTFIRWRVAAFVAAAVLASGGCGEGRQSGPAPVVQGAPAARQDALALPGPLVTREWLAGHLGVADLVVVDARPAEAYAAGHVEGAVHLPAEATVEAAVDKSRNIAPIPKVEALLGEAGISNDSAVVVYDDGADYRASARVFMVLELHGLSRAAVLDGGYPAWAAGAHPVSAEPAKRPATRFVANYHPARLATKLTVLREKDNPNVVLLDSRSKAEYTGERTQAPRAGHIPGAVHLDPKSNLVATDGTCRFVDPQQLRAAFADVPADKKVITYCNTGRSASVNYLALRLLGRDVAVYDGSWQEWASDPKLPVATGPAAGSPATTRPVIQAESPATAGTPVQADTP